MNILENEIEELIYEAANDRPHMLYERGLNVEALWCNPKVYSQFRLGSYGIMDILMIGYDPHLKTIMVHGMELKKDAINYTTLDQGLRYLKGLETYISKYFPEHKNIVVTISLVGSKIELKDAFVYLPDYMSKLSLYTYSLDLEDGLTFTNYSCYHMSNPSFKDPTPELKEDLKNIIYSQIRRKVNV